VSTVVLIAVIVAALVAVAVVVLLARRRPRRPLPPPREEARGVRAAPAPARPVGLAARLARTRRAIGDRLADLVGRGRLDDEFWGGMEEALVAADVGVAAASEVVARVRAQGPEDPAAARHLLRGALVDLLAGRDRDLTLTGNPAVVVVVGVNGSGKTTSIAKLAARLRARGGDPLLGAADTFRAAADSQLQTWADRVGVQMVGGQSGADPAAVAFDAYQAARARGKSVVIVDTAGRLHSKTNLMQELGKVVRVLDREAGRVDEVLLVLDGTSGQNAIAQARTFTAAVGVTGIVLTKLDGTARGGVAVAVEKDLGVPVKFIGVGEGMDDLVPFDPEEFVDALIEES